MPAKITYVDTLRLCGALSVLALFVVSAGPVQAQQPVTPPAPPSSEPVAAQPTNQAADSSEPQVLHLLVGRSLIITSPARIKRVSLADPEIAEALVVSPTQVLVNGKKPGGVSLLIWDETRLEE